VQFPFPWQTAKAVNCRLLGTSSKSTPLTAGVQYRLCLSPATSFPAPILDALSGYLYLVRRLRFDPRNVVLMGDSSGGHLALSLSRYIADSGLSHPGYIALTSPLGDCGRSLPSRQSLKGIDILASNMDAKPLKSALRHYTTKAVHHSYFAPAKAGPEAWGYLKKADVKVYVMVGTKELLRDDGVGIVQGMKEADVRVTMREVRRVAVCPFCRLTLMSGRRRESLRTAGAVERIQRVGHLVKRSSKIVELMQMLSQAGRSYVDNGECPPSLESCRMAHPRLRTPRSPTPVPEARSGISSDPLLGQPALEDLRPGDTLTTGHACHACEVQHSPRLRGLDSGNISSRLPIRTSYL